MSEPQARRARVLGARSDVRTRKHRCGDVFQMSFNASECRCEAKESCIQPQASRLLVGLESFRFVVREAWHHLFTGNRRKTVAKLEHPFRFRRIRFLDQRRFVGKHFRRERGEKTLLGPGVCRVARRTGEGNGGIDQPDRSGLANRKIDGLLAKSAEAWIA